MRNSSKFQVSRVRREAGSGFRVREHLFFASVVVLLFACSPKTENNNTAKFKQYYNQGELLYEKNCSNCHQKNGSGLGRLYPPLNESDYMKKNFNDVLCLMRNGKSGELNVNGLSFNQPMPGIPSLTDLEIAEIATYIYNTWSHHQGIVDVKEVSKIMQDCPPSP